MKFTLSCILLCVQICTGRSVSTNRNLLRMIGGRNATEDEFPYVVKIMIQTLATRTQSNIFLCTAAVLTSKWTLTAGHCVEDIEKRNIDSKTIQTKAVIEYKPSPKTEAAYSEIMNIASRYNVIGEVYKNDIGLLYTQPILIAQYGKLSPIDYATLKGQEVFVVGYGMIQTPVEDPPPLPQILQVVVKECTAQNIFPNICFAPSCSMPVHSPTSFCPGDSGGPAIHASGIVSVNSVSYYNNCGQYLGAKMRRERIDTNREVGIGTPVSPFTDWISGVINTETS